MDQHNRIKSILHSLTAKVIGLVYLLAFAVILNLLFFKKFILASKQSHNIFLLIVIILLIFILAHYFIHRLLKPINELNRGVQEVRKGNLDVRLKIKSSDEIGKLAKAFNQMTKELKLMIEAREQLLLDVSHELRTPLTRANIALEMAEGSEYISTVKRNLKEIETMIRELLETQRLRNNLGQLDKKKINLKKLIRQVAFEYSTDAPGIFIVPISEKLQVNADEKLVKIVLRNIMGNSLKFSPNDTKPVEISVIENTENLTIQIEDFGQGLSSGEIEKIFEPFYRTDKARSRQTGGYGLGLHLCKRIMEAHDGDINIIAKEIKKGLVVNIVFPKNDE